jgi:hypothetical protein
VNCAGCGTSIEKPRRGARKWCSDLCRKNTLYGGTCEDCGTATAYSGAAGGSFGSKRCDPCARAANTYWTQDRIVAAFQAFAREHGRTPRVTDSSDTFANAAGRKPTVHSERFPTQNSVWRNCGSWEAACLLAGLEPFSQERDHTWAVGRPLYERVA